MSLETPSIQCWIFNSTQIMLQQAEEGGAHRVKDGETLWYEGSDKPQRSCCHTVGDAGINIDVVSCEVT